MNGSVCAAAVQRGLTSAVQTSKLKEAGNHDSLSNIDVIFFGVFPSIGGPTLAIMDRGPAVWFSYGSLRSYISKVSIVLLKVGYAIITYTSIQLYCLQNAQAHSDYNSRVIVYRVVG